MYVPIASEEESTEASGGDCATFSDPRTHRKAEAAECASPSKRERPGCVSRAHHTLSPHLGAQKRDQPSPRTHTLPPLNPVGDTRQAAANPGAPAWLCACKQANICGPEQPSISGCMRV